MPPKDTQAQRKLLAKIAPSNGSDVNAGDAVEISSTSLDIQQSVNTLSSKFIEISTELEHIRIATKGSGQRLITQIEGIKNDVVALQSALTRQGRQTTEIRSDVDAQHKFDLQTQDELATLGRRIESVIDTVELLKHRQEQTAEAVIEIRKRHFSVLTISVAAALSLFFISMSVVGIGRLSKVADNKTLKTLEQYVIRHEQILQGR